MEMPTAVLAAAALFAMFTLYVIPLVGLILGHDHLPRWMAPLTVSAAGARTAAVVWTAALSAFSQVAVIAVILRPALDGPARLVFMAELIVAGAFAYWLVSRQTTER